MVKGRGERTRRPTGAPFEASPTAVSHSLPDGFAQYVESIGGTRAGAGVNLVIAAGKAAFAQAAVRMGMPERETAILKGALADIHGTKLSPPGSARPFA